jgi:methylmalonyl-CoA mutase N-terminal domain/subunit
MQARIDAGEDVVVGVNKYRLPEGKAETVDVLRIDNSSVLQSQIQGAPPALPCLVCGICAGSPLLVPPSPCPVAGIHKVKEGRDAQAVEAALKKLSAAAAMSADAGNSDKVSNDSVPSAAHRIHQPASPVLSP